MPGSVGNRWRIEIILLAGTAFAVGCATVPPVLDEPEHSWEAGCNDDGRSWQDAVVYALREEYRLLDVHGARVFPVPDSRLHESVGLLETRSFVPLSNEQATHLLSGANAKLDSRLASDAQQALARAEEREREVQDPFFQRHAEAFRKEARTSRSIAAEALRLRGGKTAPYLVRGLVLNEGTGGFFVHFEKGELSVAHGSLGHHMVPAKRRPIVVYLESSPTHVCVGVSMAE